MLIRNAILALAIHIATIYFFGFWVWLPCYLIMCFINGTITYLNYSTQRAAIDRTIAILAKQQPKE